MRCDIAAYTYEVAPQDARDAPMQRCGLPSVIGATGPEFTCTDVVQKGDLKERTSLASPPFPFPSIPTCPSLRQLNKHLLPTWSKQSFSERTLPYSSQTIG
jgi:hypothetical protein